MSKVVKKNKKRKISIQKVFNLISFTFILACCIFYGSRFIKLYLENNKIAEKETFAKTIINNNKNNSNFEKKDETYYFKGKNENNYLTYSNLTWRIVRINNDETITIILDTPITSLATGENKKFENSNLITWLNNENKENTGILEKNLNDVDKYLTNTETCNDIINDIKNITCKEKTENIYITIPSINDYVNTGGSNGFMNNDKYYYLINSNSENQMWYITNSGKVNTTDGTDIIGIKPLITIKNSITPTGGSGTIEDPYTIEETNNLFASYVKLGNDTWRVYKIEEDMVKLSLDTYLEINGEEIEYKYSNNGYYHNDGVWGSLAYYLKNKYLPSLEYSNVINEVEYSNGIYGEINNYNYKETLSKTVPTKVATLSIGDIFLNNSSTNYYTSTGIKENSNLVYVMNDDFKLNKTESTKKLKIVPVISINKNLLTSGEGTIENPWEVNNE